MSHDVLLRYAENAMPPRERVRLFVARDPRFRWVDDVHAQKGDVMLGGPTLRTILLGAIPHHLVVTAEHIDPRVLRHVLAAHGDVHFEGGNEVMTFQPSDAPDATITVTTTPHERQDFTVDSLRYRTRDNALDDPLGYGLRDLHDRRIRVLGYPLRTFANDPLRTLRALCLAAEHRLTFADETWHALTRSIPRLQSVVQTSVGGRFAFPRQTIGAALLEILAAEPRYGAALIHASGLGKLAVPDGDDGAWENAVTAMHMLVHDDTLRGHGLSRHGIATLVAGLLVFQRDPAVLAKRLVRDFHLHQFPDGHAAHLDVGDVEWLLDNVRMFDDVDPASLAPSVFEKVFGSARGRSLLALMQSAFLTEGRHHVARERVHVARRLLDALNIHRPEATKLLRGRDLEVLGVPPGPLYRRLLSKVRDAQLEGTVNNSDDALNLVRLELARGEK